MKKQQPKKPARRIHGELFTRLDMCLLFLWIKKFITPVGGSYARLKPKSSLCYSFLTPLYTGPARKRLSVNWFKKGTKKYIYK